MITHKQWTESRKGFSEFVSGREYPECYSETLYSKMKEPVEVDEEIYMYFLEVLPPFYIRNGFQCSEPVYSGSFNTFTEKDGVYWYHGHGPRGGKWLLPELKKFSEMPSELNNMLCSLLRDSCKMEQRYAATELAFTLRHLRGEPGLQEAFSSESLRIIKEFYEKEGYSFDL